MNLTNKKQVISWKFFYSNIHLLFCRRRQLLEQRQKTNIKKTRRKMRHLNLIRKMK